MRLHQLLLLLFLVAAPALSLPQISEDDGSAGAEEDEGEEDQGEEEEADYDRDDSGPRRYSLGIIDPNPEDVEDENSVGYFASVNEEEEFGDLVGAQRLDQYSSVKEGLVGPVKNQGKCNSCVAFATLAVFEVCYKKLTGESLDLSEQQLVDCGFKYMNASGCRGAPQQSYMHWIQQRDLTAEKNYPYKGDKTKLKCPPTLPPANLKARGLNAYWTNNGTEELLRRLVVKHGAVLVVIGIVDPFFDYRRGIFEGCKPGQKYGNQRHAVTVVGYGREKGKDYWLIKNSWDTTWGEKGFGKMRRGVGMCDIGTSLSVIDCEERAPCSEYDDDCTNPEDESGSEEEK